MYFNSNTTIVGLGTIYGELHISYCGTEGLRENHGRKLKLKEVGDETHL